MKPSRLFIAIISAFCLISCMEIAEKELFVSNATTFPMCDDINDSSVVFVNIKNGNKESKGCIGAYPFFNGSTIVKTQYGWSFINERFEPMFNDYFLDATHFSEGLSFTVKPNETIKAIDENGVELFELREADRVYALAEERAVFKGANGLFGLINGQGEIIVPARYTGSENFIQNNILIVSNKNSENEDVFGAINTNGDEIIPVEHPEIVRHKEGITVYRENKAGNGYKAAFYDFKGNLVYDYEFYGIIKDGNMFCYKTNKGKWGWINGRGKEMIHAEFREVMPFYGKSTTFAKGVTNSVEWGIIDKKGEWVVRPKFTSVEFTSSYPIVGIGPHSFGVIDYDGTILITTDNRSIKHISGEYYLIQNSYNELGIMKADGSGEWTVRPAYESFKGIRHKPSTFVNSDFVDIDGICTAVSSEINNMSKCTVDELMQKHNLKTSRFSKGRGSVITISQVTNRNYEIQVTAEKIYAWSSKYDWWEGTKYYFNNNAPVNNYAVTVSLKGKYASQKNTILERIRSDVGLEEDAKKVVMENKTIEVVDQSKKSSNIIKISVTIND